MTERSKDINLWEKIRFDAVSGTVWLDEFRMLLLHASAFGSLRSELIRTLGDDRAHGLLARMGFESGKHDGELARKLVGDGSLEDVFLLGPRLHSLEGVVKVESVRYELDLETGHFYGEFRWDESWEADSHIREFGITGKPSCWNQIGYASGYVTSFMNRFVVFRETHCRAKGDPCCYIVGKPADEWEDADDDIRAFNPDDFAGELRGLQDQISDLKAALSRNRTPGGLIGQSHSFKRAFDLLQRASQSAITVLLLGETGVGKEVFARWLHDNGPRADQPFVAVNCGAIPQDLIESELFGADVGAYTGATKARAGRFERADGGTLFLDELGELPLSAQVKLLRVLQTGEIERLGSEKIIKVDVRVVAATNVELAQAVAEKRFRSDLFYRINSFPVEIPPLRERRDDIPLFVDALITRYAKHYGKSVRGVSDRAMHQLMMHSWPGNVRELENLVERGVLLAIPDSLIDTSDLFAGVPSSDTDVGLGVDGHGRINASAPPIDHLSKDTFDLAAHERHLIAAAMERAGGNVTKAATLLGLTRRQLDYRLNERDR